MAMQQTKPQPARHYCTHCGKKTDEAKMALVGYPLLKKSAWHCLKCMSAFADVGAEKRGEKKPVFIEMFSGSGQVAAAARSAGFQTITIDIEEKHKPDVLIDILNLKNQNLPGNVAVIWASVPCTVYSTLSVSHHWQKVSIGWRQYQYIPKTKEAVKALRILNKTLRLIKHLKPAYYFIENPRGALRHFPQMTLIPFRKTVEYYSYGMDYYKPTDIFTNCPHWQHRPLKGATGRVFRKSIKDLPNAYERSLIPGELIDEIISCVKHLVN